MERPQVAALVVSSQPAPSTKLPHGPAEPLAPIAGKSILGWVVDAALGASVRRIALLGQEPTIESRRELIARSDKAMIEFVTPTRDVADSMAFALERLGSDLTLRDSTQVLILPAESPQIATGELRELIEHHVDSRAAATLLGGVGLHPVDDEPVVARDYSGRITSIADATSLDTGVLCIQASMLVPALRRVIAPRWRSGAPLSEIAGVLDEMGHKVEVLNRATPLTSISSAASRTPIEMELRDRVIKALMERGAVMPDPRQVTIDATVTLGQGVQVLPGSVIEGSTVVGDGAVIGPNSHLVNALVGSGACVPHSVVWNSEVGASEVLQPFSVLGAAAR